MSCTDSFMLYAIIGNFKHLFSKYDPILACISPGGGIRINMKHWTYYRKCGPLVGSD